MPRQRAQQRSSVEDDAESNSEGNSHRDNPRELIPHNSGNAAVAPASFSGFPEVLAMMQRSQQQFEQRMLQQQADFMRSIREERGNHRQNSAIPSVE